MGTEENKAVVRRFYEELANGRRYDLAEELMTADHRYIDPQIPGVPAGPRGMAEALRVYQEGVEGRWAIEDMVAESDRVAVRWRGTGRHTGTVNGIPPTGRPVDVSAVSIHRLEGGKIAENWTVWDTLTFLQQLGVAPAPGQAE